MSVYVIDTIKPKNGGSFPVVEAVDVAVSGGTRLNTALEAKANASDLANKADKSDISDIRTTLALKANQSSLDALGVVVANKAAQSSLDALGVVVAGKADKIDYDNIYAAINTKADKSTVSELNNEVNQKANAADVTTDVNNLQNQIDQIEISASAVNNLQNQIDQIEISASAESVVAPEVAAARVDSVGESHETLKARIDSDANGEKADVIYINNHAVSAFQYNLINSEVVSNLVDNEYVQYNDGVAHALEGWNHTDYVEVLPNAKYAVNKESHVCFYNTNKVYVSGTLTNQPGYGATITVPSGCRYAIFSYHTADTDMCVAPGTISRSYSPDEKHINLTFETNGSFTSTIDPISAHTFGSELLDISAIMLSTRQIENGVYYSGLDGRKGTNVIYCATDLMSCKAQKEYTAFGTTEGHACFYDITGTFISGTLLNQRYHGVDYGNKFTTPVNCEFVRLSIQQNVLNVSGLMASNQTQTPYKYIVSKDSSGDYSTIAEAISAASDGDIIFVKKGEYNETLSISKNVHLIGENRINTIIYNTDGNYANCPVYLGAGMIENFTIYAKNDSSSPSDPLAYAVHVEKNTLYNSQLAIKDCIIKSDFNSALGMGMRGGCNILFENIDFINTVGERALYFHDADSESYVGVQNITIRNCRMKVTGGNSSGIITMQSQERSGTMVYVTYQNNHVFSKQGSTDVHCFNYYGGTSTNPDDYQGMINWRLTDDSFGNNVNNLNA